MYEIKIVIEDDTDKRKFEKTLESTSLLFAEEDEYISSNGDHTVIFSINFPVHFTNEDIVHYLIKIFDDGKKFYPSFVLGAGA